MGNVNLHQAGADPDAVRLYRLIFGDGPATAEVALQHPDAPWASIARAVLEPLAFGYFNRLLHRGEAPPPLAFVDPANVEITTFRTGGEWRHDAEYRATMRF